MTTRARRTPFELLEDARDAGPEMIHPDAILSDQTLYEGGLVKTTAYVRTRWSKAAERTRRSRERAAKGEGEGPARKQVSILAPPDEDARAALRDLGRRMAAGEVSPDQLSSLGQPREAVVSAPEATSDEAREIGRRALDIIAAGGLRGRLLGRLLRAGRGPRAAD